jgi:16S rRNA (guanine527-N7)-methyltransferase
VSQEAHQALTEVLDRSRELGYLGGVGIEEQIRHARAFADAIDDGWSVLDLGSGGGLPGLVVAVLRPSVHVVLLDASERRCAFLRWAVRRLGIASDVLEGRAEVLAHGPDRGRFDAVTARSFGRPAIVAECSAGFLGDEGVVIVSEPPDGSDGPRWPRPGLARVGLEPASLICSGACTLQVLRRNGAVPPTVPRTTRQMARSPLF